MTAANKESKKFLILIDKQLNKVKHGGDASCLASLMNQYQFSTSRNQQLTLEQVSNYYSALFLSHRFIELSCVVMRNIQNVRIPQDQAFAAASEYAKNQDYKSLIETTKKLVEVTQSQLKNHFIKSVKSYILQTLGRDYISIDAQFLRKNYGIQKQDIEESGCTINGNYVYLKEKKEISNVNDLMLTRIRQLSEVTQNVIKGVH